MIKCVCLVEETADKILLVQVRHREKYYFPGGKIEEGETQVHALLREIQEELNLTLTENDIEYVGTIVGPAYPQLDMLTELNGYRSLTKIDWNHITINNEITDIRWIDKKDDKLIAPAVKVWIEENGGKYAKQ
ncbi:NUDIX hydrolase [Staphylococcus argenteus]|uniref:NUDIX hydrolase n=1 Tax=Staphylococcus argenteus TaxID=985002 RepID=UPI0005031C5B|nr:NUDIX domain-containing protein [Staphylococcus argenteus]MBE2132641.1 NUDIX domain-containing protein [Staphylococcus argenteus]MBE2147482.1 NUDIX domain-containing protein [Staphylococcus argenteus]MBE2161983.1 NUDIX domain-containing protein [Staphylococcus argenteus]MCG9797284.1 NUDIX domain-containing protein [Staphylococcus argenteus]MCG9799205.1 NUDIX domain-containing protein [Staphylococcus argenteus]